MDNIKIAFLLGTIPDLLNPKINMKYVKFVFDSETLKELVNCLDKSEKNSYQEGLRSIDYLCNIKKEMEEGKEGIYIPVHDSKNFFSLLNDLVKEYSKSENHTLIVSYNFIRSIWLRMGVNDINNVEVFLERQLKFLKNDGILKGNNTLCQLDDKEYLIYNIKTNEDWFETNKAISFGIYKQVDDNLFESLEYEFPRIHYGLIKENNHAKCYIYGMQSIHETRNDEIKEKLQPIRSSLRNKYIAADFVIGMSLFLDFLYKNGINEVEIPTLQVFNYEYHKDLSENTKKNVQKIKKQKEVGIIKETDSEFSFIDKLEKRFVDKEDIISYNKTERFIEMFNLLMDINPNIELVSEPLINGENMIIHLNGKTDILKNYSKKRTK